MNDLLKPFRRGPWRRLSDRDLWHSLSIAALAALASGGLLYLFWLRRVWRTALHAADEPQRARCLLLFGKRLLDSGIDADYAARIARLHALLHADPARQALLLGGDSGKGSEARAALARLHQLGLPRDSRVQCEDASIDTLENLRNARELLGEVSRAPVAIVSSRYHLARCLLLARALGFDAEPCAAQTRLRLTPALAGRLALEAGYCLWFDVGTRWSRFIGNARMLERVS